MKATGITRKIDEMGRFVVPMEIRREMGIKEGDSLEIFMNDEQIVIQKYKSNLEKSAVIEELNHLITRETDTTMIQTFQRAIHLIK